MNISASIVVGSPSHSPARVYFHHIAKTAGTALRSVLIQQLGELSVTSTLLGVKLSDALREYSDFSAITGHLSIIPGDRLPSDRYNLTLLRDPLDCLLSTFYFQRAINLTGQDSYASAMRSAMNLKAWVESLDINQVIPLNPLCHALWALGSETALPPDQIAKAAIRALDLFDAIGIQARFTESVAIFSLALGWHVIDKHPHTNRNATRPLLKDLPSWCLDRLRNLLLPDYEVYDHGLELFARQRTTTLIRAVNMCSSAGAKFSTEHPARIEPPIPVPDSSVPMLTNEIMILAVNVTGLHTGIGRLQVGEWASISIELVSNIDETDLTVTVRIRAENGALVFGTNSRLLGQVIELSPGRCKLDFGFPNQLGLGRYTVTVGALRGWAYLGCRFDWRENIASFDVVDNLFDRFDGRQHLHMYLSIAALDAHTARLVERADNAGATIIGCRNPSLTDFRAKITADCLDQIPNAADALVPIEIENCGAEHWRVHGRRSVSVAYHWTTVNGEMIEFEGIRTPIPHDIAPGQALQLKAFLRAPDQPGQAILMWTLVQDEVAWFSDHCAQSQLSMLVQINTTKI